MTAELRSWRMRLPFTAPLSLNHHVHHMKAHRLRTAWRDAAWALAKSHKIPRLERFTVILRWEPRDRRRRDLDNLVASTKPLVDGLILAGVADDDDQEHYVPTNPVIDEPTGEPGRLWLEVKELPHA